MTDFLKRSAKALEAEAKKDGATNNTTEAIVAGGAAVTGGTSNTGAPTNLTQAGNAGDNGQNRAGATAPAQPSSTNTPAAPPEPARPAGTTTNGGAAGTPDPIAGNGGAGSATVVAPTVVLDDNEIVMRVLRERGINVADLDELGARVNNVPLTADQQRKIDAQREKRALDRFLETGKGTMDDFYSLRSLRDMKDVDLVREDYVTEAKKDDASLTDEEAEDMFNRQFFVGDDYTDAEKKVGGRRLKQTAEAIRAGRMQPLTAVEQELHYDEEVVKANKEWAHQVDAWLPSMPKSFTVPLGKMGNTQTDLGDFNYNFSAEEQQEFAQTLKDPTYLLKQIGDPKTGKTDLSKLFDLLRWKWIGERAVKSAALENYSKGVDAVSAGLTNYPNLHQTGSTSAPTSANEIEQGNQIVRNDARQIMGRQTFRKKLPTG